MQRRTLVLLIPLTLALAQSPADQKPATIEGTVVNSVTGMPLRKADVTLVSGEMSPQMAAMARQFGSGAELEEVGTRSLATVTDAAGKFRFEQVSPGTYRLRAQKPAFADGRYPRKSGSLRLTAGQEMAHVEIRLVPYATLSGHVLDEDGEPFPTALVSALSYSLVYGRRRLMPVELAQTNNKGEFSLPMIPPGHYLLSADVAWVRPTASIPAPPADGALETGYVSTYLPSTPDVADAQRIYVAAGAELSGFNIQLRKSLVVRVKGRLVDANGVPIKAGQIRLMGAGRVGPMPVAMVRDPQGTFEIPYAQPGAYTAMMTEMQGPGPGENLQPLVVPDRNVENLELVASPVATIEGRVAVDGDAKMPDEFQFSLTVADGRVMMARIGRTDKFGAFTLDHVARAPYELRLPLFPEGTYLKSVLFNGHESLGQPLDCSSLTTGTLRIVLGTDGGKLEAHVSRDGKPALNATVALLPSDPNGRYLEAVRTGSSDASGHLTLKDVAPGDYLAFAWEDVEDGIWFDPDFLKAQPQGVRVRIGPKATEQVELNLIPAAQ